MQFSSENLFETLHSIDIILIVLLTTSILLLPKFFAHKKKSSATGMLVGTKQLADREFLLMSGGLTLPLFVATLTASWYGGIFGVTQIAFEHGVYGFVTQGLFWYIAYAAFALCLARTIRRKKVLSLPELIGKKFGERARRLSAIILFFHALPVTYAVSVGLLLTVSIGLPFQMSVLLGVAIVATYTSMGGFRGVVLTDLVQFFLMFAAVIAVVIACIYRFGGITFLLNTLPAEHFSWHGEALTTNGIIWLFIACSSTFIHPVFYQRCLAASSDSVAVRGIFSAMLLWLLFDVCTTLGGMYARAIIPDVDSATAYIRLGVQVLPIGIKGIFIAGILATILSTLDSFLFVSGTTLSYDLKLWRNSIFSSHHGAILCSALIITVLSFIFGSNFESIWLFMEGAFSTALLTPTLAAVWARRQFSSTHFLVPSIAALVVFSCASILYAYEIIYVHAFYAAHITAFLCFCLCIALQLIANRRTKLTNLTDA